MPSLQPPDSHHLNAAQGWLDLANPREAAAELAKVAPGLRDHPAVLEARWRLHAAEKRWEEALAVARLLIQKAPHEPGGWVDQAYALHELKQTREAMRLLLPLARRFPKAFIIPYNLACYACQLGDDVRARQWLEKAARAGSKAEIKQMALKDADLRPLWPELAAW